MMELAGTMHWARHAAARLGVEYRVGRFRDRSITAQRGHLRQATDKINCAINTRMYPDHHPAKVLAGSWKPVGLRTNAFFSDARKQPSRSQCHSAPEWSQDNFSMTVLQLEQHFTPAQVATLWALSENTIRSLFENEPGVLIINRPERIHKRGYRSMRIPESVVRRVGEKLGHRKAA
jgi:hypothetical protein